jgi:sorting nexin-8
MLLDTTLESLKSQRDLHIAMRDLFVRHEHLSKDSVERLKKRVETSSARLETIKKAQKDNWQEEVDKVLSSIEKDQATIASQLNRRVFIRACLWHELRVVLHNRENTLLTLAVQTFAQEEQEYTESVMNTWGSLVEALENMPVE